jgi:hypothetical protein
MKKKLMAIAILFLAASVSIALAQSADDSVPPAVVKSAPQAGANAVDPGQTELTVTFSKDMLPNSWSWVKVSDESFPKLTGEPRYLADQRTCVLPVKLEPNRHYRIWINAESKFNQFRDRAGHPAVPYLLDFKTK